MSTQNRDQPGMEMIENEYANCPPPEQSTSRVRNNEKLETMIRETKKSVQKLMWLSLIFLLLSFIVGFVALYFSISAKVEMETRRALQTTLLKQIKSSTEAIQSAEKSLTMWKSTLQHNMTTMEARIFDVQAISANYSSRLIATNNSIESIQTTLAALEEQRICAGVVYRDHCYWLPWIVATYGGHGGKSAAANVCSLYGTTLVDIETEEQYDVLYKYIQKAWVKYVDRPTTDFVEVWLASSYTNGNVVSSTGGSVYTRWYSGYPNNSPGIVWVVGTKPTRTASYTGMFTWTESNSHPVPFCRL